MTLLSREEIRERLPTSPIVIAAWRVIKAHLKFGSVGVHSPLTAVAAEQRPEGVVWFFLATHSRQFLIPPLSHIQSTTSWVGFTSSVSLLIFSSPARTRPRSPLLCPNWAYHLYSGSFQSPPCWSAHLMVQLHLVKHLDGASEPLTWVPDSSAWPTGSSPSGPRLSLPFPLLSAYQSE